MYVVEIINKRKDPILQKSPVFGSIVAAVDWSREQMTEDRLFAGVSINLFQILGESVDHDHEIEKETV